MGEQAPDSKARRVEIVRDIFETGPLRICRYCDQPITDPDEAAFLWHEPAASGPGWNVYAHPGHSRQVKPPLAPLLLLARIRARKATRPNP